MELPKSLADHFKMIEPLTAAEAALPKIPQFVIPDHERLHELRKQQVRLPPVIPNPIVENVKANLASEFHNRLIEWINDFDSSLDTEHEVGVRLVSFGQEFTFHLRDIAYSNPSLISFSGETDDGAPVQLLQHVAQISILLMKLPRLDPAEPKRPLGFHVIASDRTDQEGC